MLLEKEMLYLETTLNSIESFSDPDEQSGGPSNNPFSRISATALKSGGGGGGGGVGSATSDFQALLSLLREVSSGGGGASAGEDDETEPVAQKTEELVDVFGVFVEEQLVKLRSLESVVEDALEKERFKISQTTNATLRINVILQLVTVVLAACSAISGYFGMNLDNGVCGPEGCHGRQDSGCVPKGRWRRLY